MNKAFKRLELLDSIFLLILVFVSALPWVGELGFYSDDWSYLAALRESAPAGLSAMFRSLVHTDSGLLVRPVQLACLVLEFKAFGLHPLPYHLLIAALLGATVVLLYVVLRASSIARCYSVAMAIIFAFLPQYSTDRFWLSSQQTLLCMLFALAGIAAMLRYASPSGSRKAPWLAAASTCFVASILSYEVALGIIVASIVVVAWRTFRRSSGEHRALSILPPLGVALPIVLFGLLKILFQHRYVLHHRIPLFWLRGEIWKLAAFHAFQFNLGNYVFRLPSVLASLYRQSAITAGSAAAAAAVAILLTLYFLRFQDESQVLTRLAGFKAIAFGLVLFGLGYALFSPVPGTAFESAGLNNRITIASALGASCVIVGLITLVCMV